MTTKNKLIGFLIPIILASIILPFLFKVESEPFNQTLNTVGGLISSIAGLITLLIAIILFNKFGIETPLLEKKTEIVFSFIEEYKKVVFSIGCKRFVLFVRLYNPDHLLFEEWYSEKLMFSPDYADGLNTLNKISNNPFMPKTISEKMNNLNFNMLLMDIENKDIDEYAKVIVSGKGNKENKFGRFNGEDLTLYDYLNLIDELRNEIISWLEKNSSYSVDLNI